MPSVFCDTGLEYPEVRRFALSQPNVTVIKPKMRFDEVIQKYGWPIIYKEAATYIYEIRHTKSEKLREKRLNGEPNASGGRSGRLPNKYRYLLDAPFEISAKCCHVMKRQSMARYERESGRKPYTGIMAEESNLRKQSWLKYGCNAFEQKANPCSHPIMFWTEQDILRYLQAYQLPYATVYGDIIEDKNGLTLTGLRRTGCMFCGFGCHLEPEPNRFQRMKETHPAQYKYCMDKLGLREVLDYIGVPYE